MSRDPSGRAANLSSEGNEVDALVLEGAAPAVRAHVAELVASHRSLVAELQQQAAHIDALTRELEETEARFRDIIERNADAIIVVDREGRVRFANQAAARFFGTAIEDLVGSAFGFPVVAGETTELDVVSDGDTRVVEMRVVDSAWDGRSAHIASLRDVTHRKRAEESARRLAAEQAARRVAETAARRFRFLAESSAMLASSLDYMATLSALARVCTAELADWAAVYCLDHNQMIRRVDVVHRDPAKAQAATALRECPITHDQVHPVREMLRTRQSLLIREVTPQTLPSLASTSEHLELMRQLGVASFMLVPLIARNRVLGAIAVVSSSPERLYDTDDLALAEDLALRAALAIDNAALYQKAHEENQTKSDFLAVISHDLRTPLNSIIGYAELLMMGLPDALSDGARERVDRIRLSARHLLYLMDELLTFVRLDAHKEDVRPRLTDLCELVQEVGAVMEPLAAEHHLRLQFDLPDQPVLLKTDSDKVRQILVNLVGNAVKYTEQGQVNMQVARGANTAILRVADTGIGIAPEYLEKIFEPFWQIDKTQRTRGGGTGLGLSVVRRLVALLDGEIQVDSTPGHGSTFTIALPA